jgi:hypothetical protein
MIGVVVLVFDGISNFSSCGGNMLIKAASGYIEREKLVEYYPAPAHTNKES